MTSAAQFGSSATLCDAALEDQLLKLDVSEVVDFGCGAGKNGKIIRRVLGNDCKLIGVEGYRPAVDALREAGGYDRVDFALLQEWVERAPDRHNVALFGDVIEHLTPREIHRVMRACVRKFDHIIVVVPLHDIFQDDSYGNELEIHKSYVTEGFFDRYRPHEKHVVTDGKYTIMNLLITPGRGRKPFLARALWGGFHVAMLTLQPVGLARPLVAMLKSIFGRRVGRARQLAQAQD